MEENACRHCKDRYPACQDHCQFGIARAEKEKIRRETIKKARNEETRFNAYKFDRIFATKQRCNMI